MLRPEEGRLGTLLAQLESLGFKYVLNELIHAAWMDSGNKPPFTSCRLKNMWYRYSLGKVDPFSYGAKTGSFILCPSFLEFTAFKNKLLPYRLYQI